MMKKLVYILPLVAALFFTTACDDEDYRDPSTIVNGYMDEYRTLLASSELGWRFDYYPNEAAYGAFTFMMKFREDGRVEMQTDENFFYLFATDEEKQKAYGVQESDYTIQNSQGPVLTFATYSLLSKLADPELFNIGSGWQGDNEFVLMGKSISGDTIYLKSVRAQRRCFLVKNQVEWDDYFTRLNKVIRDFSNESVANNYFRDILLNRGAEVDTAVMTGFDMTARMAVIYQYEGEKMNADTCQLHFKTDGVYLKRPVNVKGVNITHFSYNDSPVFHVNGDENSSIQVAENGRPMIKFKVRDKVLRGQYTVEKDSVIMSETDLYFVSLNPSGSDDEWDELFKCLKDYLYMVLIPDNTGKYYVDLYDQIVNESGQSNVVLARCGFIHQWSYSAEDEIAFRGASTNNMMFLGTDSETGDYEPNTPLAREYSSNVKSAYASYLNSVFGSSMKRINCVVVPSPVGEEFYFVNKADGSYLGIMKI